MTIKTQRTTDDAIKGDYRVFEDGKLIGYIITDKGRVYGAHFTDAAGKLILGSKRKSDILSHLRGEPKRSGAFVYSA